MIPLVAFAISITSSFAIAKVTAGDKIMLQATMQQAISDNLVDGKYFYFDAKAAKVNALYPAQNHPIILRMGEHFILCTDFRTSNGKSVNVDFYISRKGDSFVVFDTVVANRAPIERMMKAKLVEMVK